MIRPNLVFSLIMTLILGIVILGCLLVAVAAFTGGAILAGMFFIVLALIGCVLIPQAWEWHGPA